jgi:hypothetical protein
VDGGKYEMSFIDISIRVNDQSFTVPKSLRLDRMTRKTKGNEKKTAPTFGQI